MALTKEQLLIVKEIAYMALDPEVALYEDMAEQLDLSDEVLAELRYALSAELQEERPA